MNANTPLDKLLCQPIRLAVIAYLIANDGKAAFVEVARDCHIKSLGVLSAHNEVLERAGYIRLRKEIVGKKQRTTLVLTDRGEQAFAAHRAAFAVVTGISSHMEAAE